MPSEPWRYRCPYCLSPTIRRCRNYDDASGGGPAPAARWYCKGCESPFDEPIDMKHDEVAA
ncbi:hypothetical protein [Natrinema pallidum]|uniref:Uncharacterized protein n=1 Tax=Natrinema pallidum TaxID=69527 RepID=A0A4P9TJW1_9EURY|nr:hypothetical protein [Natrinema pallidum]QCW05301.1 hypothetical protein FGF80_18850 [Natrinema pallidum]